MYKKYLFIIFLFGVSIISSSQTQRIFTGFPERSDNLNLFNDFKNPPAGYGDVAFYWWIGDTLTKERILWQLEELKDKKVTGLQINYCHTDAGGASYGLTFPSQPALFSEKWWELFQWFVQEAKKRGMAVSLSDYTLGAAGQGWFVDEMLAENPGMIGSKLESQQWNLADGEQLTTTVPFNLISLTAFPLVNEKPDEKGYVNLKPAITNSQISWKAPAGKWKVVAVYRTFVRTSFDPMHPLSGKKVVEKFYQRFEDHCPGEAGKGLNFFFSDELQFGIRGFLWNNNFSDEFIKQKGYDITPDLCHLFMDFGPKSYKIRLDYNDVMVRLSEEGFFKPVYNWHTDRGMLFGCDHGGRGRDITEFGDYFRTQRWMSGPGADQPRLGKDLIKAKVAASIAHMYERPRVWLEGFYGSGWGTSSADITDAVLANYVLGFNLLSLHGLYYTTKGGWWEWAPPCNHFHMPYWKHIDPLMVCVERLSYLMSQGYHRCDVAILYPTERAVVNQESKKPNEIAFSAGQELYNKGIDFDYMDYETLERAEVKNGELLVSGEKFKVLVIPSMKVLRHSSLIKINKFKEAGGLVVNIGDLPVATELSGVKDEEVTALISNLFKTSSNLVSCGDEMGLTAAISGKYEPDFKILSELNFQPYVMHRIVGNREIYALYNFPAGTKCFFKTTGKVELWNPWTAERLSISKLATVKKNGTEIRLPLSEKEIQLIVFTQDQTTEQEYPETQPLKKITLEGDWEFELKPSLDNQWGDFQLPASEEMLGAEVRQPFYKRNAVYQGGKIQKDSLWKRVTLGYGNQFLKLGVIPVLPSEQDFLKMIPGEDVDIQNKKYKWEEYGFSWQLGVEGDYGHQGYHGLKGEMYDNFIRLGKLVEYKHSLKRGPEPGGNYYILYTSAIAPAEGAYGLLTGTVKPLLMFVNGQKTDVNSSSVNLKKGGNAVLMVYDKACETYLVFRKADVPKPEKQPVSMCWFGDNGVLPFEESGLKPNSGLFTFNSAPGLKSLSFSAYGKLQVWVNGIVQKSVPGLKKADGLTSYTVLISKPEKQSVPVVFKVDFKPGFGDAAAFPAYIRETCETGTIATGDWSEIDGLRAYSGGAVYRKQIQLTNDDLKNNIEIDLGDVVSSAELVVNGKSAGIRVAPPWKYDLTPLVKPGENKIEVVVYNTLANNYTTIPTRYRGAIKSGLIGPVTLNFGILTSVPYGN